MFRDGDFNDKKFLQTLFDTFLVSVYLYEDKFKVFFSFAGDKNTVELPLDVDSCGEDGSSEAVCISSPQLHQIKTLILIQCIGFGVLILFHPRRYNTACCNGFGGIFHTQ